MKTIPISLTLARSAQLRWWQAGKLAPIDCTGFTCTVHETTLPYSPAITTVNAAQGAYRIEAPTAPQIALLRRGRRYAATVVLRDGGGAIVEAADLVFEAIR